MTFLTDDRDTFTAVTLSLFKACVALLSNSADSAVRADSASVVAIAILYSSVPVGPGDVHIDLRGGEARGRSSQICEESGSWRIRAFPCAPIRGLVSPATTEREADLLHKKMLQTLPQQESEHLRFCLFGSPARRDNNSTGNQGNNRLNRNLSTHSGEPPFQKLETRSMCRTPKCSIAHELKRGTLSIQTVFTMWTAELPPHETQMRAKFGVSGARRSQEKTRATHSPS
jgi:hypothetical protein